MYPPTIKHAFADFTMFREASLFNQDGENERLTHETLDCNLSFGLAAAIGASQ